MKRTDKKQAIKELVNRIIDGHDPEITMDTRELLEVCDKIIVILDEEEKEDGHS